ncbi:hypothetical protein HPB50_012450 [Hyalomma asiaticum]|uniref:Uncharacterized protein n=1 Tax=Hyalomma asiaticum TaxID=266040 RepID=A0ACB7TFD7_HYAAI|nr:hypothetical protein HPB50_012450 [Hyalomma asiaticum]
MSAFKAPGTSTSIYAHELQIPAGNISSRRCSHLPARKRDVQVFYNRPLPRKTVNIAKSALISNVALPTPSKAKATTAMFHASRRTSALHRGRSMTVHDTFRKWSPGKEASAW